MSGHAMAIVAQVPLGDGHMESVIETDSRIPLGARIRMLAEMAQSERVEQFRLVASCGGLDGILAVSDAPGNLDGFVATVVPEEDECYLRGTFIIGGDRYDIIWTDGYRMYVLHDIGNDVAGELRKRGFGSLRPCDSSAVPGTEA